MLNKSKENCMQLIASFMIVLILTIPFYTTSVYAKINKITVTGGDGIAGFAKSNDLLNFDVQASLFNETVTNDKVLLGASIKFGTCTSITNGSDCILRFPGNGTQPFEAKLIPFTINLIRSNGTIDDSKQGNVIIDNKAPQVKLTIKQKTSSSQGNFIINFDVTDFACDDPSCANICVGIKSIDFFTLDGSFQQTLNPSTSSCNVNSDLTIAASALNNGKNSIFARATDKFNQVSQDTSVTFDASTVAPGVITSSFAIISKGISLSTFSSNPVPVIVAVNISGDINLNSVTADLSSLNPGSNLKNAKASCVAVESAISTCTWNIDLNPGQSGVKNILINATDNSGNKAGTAISKQMALDDKGPVVLSLSANSASNSSQQFVKSSGNTVTAAFDEATGLSSEDVFLNVNGRRIGATSCSKSTSWKCQWNNVNFGSSASMSIDSDTTDVLENPVAESFSSDITVDTRAPVLRSINITPVGGLVQAFPGFFKVGDKIAVVANVTEDNDVVAVADFSKFVSGASRVFASCEKVQDNENTCTWLTDSVDLQNSDIITFNFSDSAGNTLTATKSLKTFGLETSTNPDFWKNTVACSPSSIDRSLGPLINQRVFCLVALTPKSLSKPVSTVFISPASCSGDSSIVDSVETINNVAGSTSPVIKIILKKNDFKINNATLQCSLNIFSKIGSATTITQNPEVETANINISFFNLPLGELGDAVQKKIDQAKKDAEGILDIIGTLNKIVFYAKKICQIINTIFNILGLLMLVYMIFATASTACTGTGILESLGICSAMKQVKGTMCGSHDAATGGAENLKGYSDKFCAMVNCKTTFLWGPTVQNWINNAPLLIGPGQYLGPKTQIDEKAGFFDQKVVPVGGSSKDIVPTTVKDYTHDISVGTGKPRPVSEYMDPQHNLIVATLFVCIPGIIYGLDKYRQIQCLYADCLQNAVGQEGLPITACEDQKAYATCKYITGEIFALFPWTAVLDHFMSIIKNALSNPFSTLGIAVAIFCRKPSCIASAPLPDSGQIYFGCAGIRLLTLVGDAAQNVKNIIDTGFTIRTDYCDRLKDKKTTSASSFDSKTSSGSGVTNTTKKT